MVKKNNVNNHFDVDNLKLILFCAIFGVFGVHKFMQHKIWQGIVFILLDLTVFGFIATFLWAFIDLIFLTTKKDNPSANIICGLAFIFVQIIIGGYTGLVGFSPAPKEPISIHHMNKVGFQKHQQRNQKRISDSMDFVHARDARKLDKKMEKNIEKAIEPSFDFDDFVVTISDINDVTVTSDCNSSYIFENNVTNKTDTCNCEVQINGKTYKKSFDKKFGLKNNIGNGCWGWCNKLCNEYKDDLEKSL